MPVAESRRLARWAAALVVVSFALLIAVAVIGPSAAEPALGPRAGWRGLLPAYALDLRAGSGLVTALLDLAYVLGGAGVGLGLLAVRRGHRLDPRRVGWAGLVLAAAAVLVPPLGSADHLNYAAYGRIAAQGGDPYVVAPAAWDGGRDPVTSAVEAPWRTTPSVYGPVATALQAGTSVLGGDSVRATVWFWQLLCAAAWFGIGGLLLVVTRRRAGPAEPGPGAPPPAPAGQSRALWLWLLNPVLFGVLVLGAHVDVIATAFAMVAVVLAVRHPFWAGVALGAAVGCKLTLLLAVPALLWGLKALGARRALRCVLFGTAGAALVLAPAHLWAGPHVFDQLDRARSMVSLGTPWRPVVEWLTGPVDGRTVRHWVEALTPLLVLLVAVALARVARPAPALTTADPQEERAVRDRVVSDASLALLVLGAAYVLAAPYSLPWYDAMVWAPLALVAGGVLDAVLLARLVAMAVAYVPGRVLGMSASVEHATLWERRHVTPAVGWLVLALLGVLALRRRRPPPPRPGSATR